MICPYCKSECKAPPFGYGWVVICRKCKRIIYNDKEKPKEVHEDERKTDH